MKFVNILTRNKKYTILYVWIVDLLLKLKIINQMIVMLIREYLHLYMIVKLENLWKIIILMKIVNNALIHKFNYLKNNINKYQTKSQI